jgi:hypothetical protein
MTFPLFIAGTTYEAGARVSTPTGEVFEKVKTGRVTAAPKVGTTWRKVVLPVQPPAVGEGPITYRTMANFRSSPTLPPLDAIFYLCDKGLERHMRYVGLTDREDNEGLVLKGPWGQTYETIIEHNTVCLNWFGLVPEREDMADHNTRITDVAIRSINYRTLLVRKPDGADVVTYHWNRLPGSGIFSDQEEACISFEDRIMVFEFELGVYGLTEPGYAAVQSFPRYSPTYVVERRTHFSHRGGPDRYEGALPDGKGGYLVDEEGQLRYSEDWGSYKKPGRRQWSYGEWHGVNYYGYSGPGACVFGQIGVCAPRVYRDFTGWVDYWNGDMFVHPNKPEDLAEMSFPDTLIELDSGHHLTVNRARPEDKSVNVSYGSPETTGLPVGAKVVGRYARKTLDFFADFIQAYPLDGMCNFDGNRGPGVLIVGAEANHGNFQAVSCRDNYGPGFVDWSFLGCKIWARHCTTNGKGFLRKGRTTMGGYMTGWNPNTSSTDVAAYDEEGQAPNQLWGNASILGGFNLNGVVGGGGTLQNNRLQGFAQLDTPGRVEGKASLMQSRMAAVVEEIASKPTLAEARAAYVAQNLMRLPLAA